MLVSVGLGLSTLAAVALIQGNVQREIPEQLPADAPSFFFVDIQDSQLPRFEALVTPQPGVADMQQVPSPARAHRLGERRASRPGARHARNRAGRCAATAA